MNRVRNRLIAAFLAATVIPLIATVWITTALLDRSLDFATTEELDQLSLALEETARELYQLARRELETDVARGRVPDEEHLAPDRARWPASVEDFWESGESARFAVSGPGGSVLDYLIRTEDGVHAHSRNLGDIRMGELATQYGQARQTVEAALGRDLRRGFTLTLVTLVAAVWVASLLSLIYLAHRISGPIQQLTGGLGQLAGGDLGVRLRTDRHDETGQAIRAFNHMADRLEQSQERLIYLTQVASWQALARKMAHELKNSLTPIRLTVEEMLARSNPEDRRFLEQAADIVVSEVETLERRVRAFSEFSSEPSVNPEALDVNALIEERVAFLRPGHCDVTYELSLDDTKPTAWADADHTRGILTNLLENAAEAAGPAGSVRTATGCDNDRVFVEVHDSGPGLSAEARDSLFQPTITFKKRGMGLGLSIARKSALLAGGDIMLIDSQLGGAGFRVVLPAARS